MPMMSPFSTFSEAPLAYLLSALAAVIYIAATVGLLGEENVPADYIGQRHLFKNHFAAALSCAVVTGHAQTVQL